MPSHADGGLNSKAFLAQSEKSRTSYLRVSIMMAHMIAVENSQQQAACIGDWYSKDQAARDQYIFGVMKEYPDAHPMGILVAILEKQCGSFKYANP